MHSVRATVRLESVLPDTRYRRFRCRDRARVSSMYRRNARCLRCRRCRLRTNLRRLLIPEDFDPFIPPVEMKDELAPVDQHGLWRSRNRRLHQRLSQRRGTNAASNSAGDNATLTALLEGLGIDASTVRHIPADDLARLVGGMLRDRYKAR